MGTYSEFKSFLDRKDAFYEEDITEDGEKFIRIRETIKNGEPLAIVFLFNQQEDQIGVRVFNIAQIDDEEKYADLLVILNNMNKHVRFWKFLAGRSGEVWAEFDVKVAPGQDYEDVLFPVSALVFVINNKDLIKPLMQLKWS